MVAETSGNNIVCVYLCVYNKITVNTNNEDDGKYSKSFVVIKDRSVRGGRVRVHGFKPCAIFLWQAP